MNSNDFSGRSRHAWSEGFPRDHDIKSLENVEQHLRATLAVERLRAGMEVSVADGANHALSADCERRLNRGMHLSECFPDGRMALRGRLSGLSATLDPDTYRAYLYRAGSIATVLYINFELQTCVTAALVPA